MAVTSQPHVLFCIRFRVPSCPSSDNPFLSPFLSCLIFSITECTESSWCVNSLHCYAWRHWNQRRTQQFRPCMSVPRVLSTRTWCRFSAHKAVEGRHNWLKQSDYFQVLQTLDSQRQGDMLGALRKLFRSHRSKHQNFMGEDVGGKKISPDISLHGVRALESFEGVEQPPEPTEIDNPAPCPPPQNSIVQDGLMWRERVARNCRRQIERNSTWQEGDGVRLTGKVSNPGSSPDLSNLRKTSLFMTHSAPEITVSKMLV